MDIITASRTLQVFGAALLFGGIILTRERDGLPAHARLLLVLAAGFGAALLVLGGGLDLVRIAAAYARVGILEPQAWQAVPTVVGGTAYGAVTAGRMAAGLILAPLAAAAGPWGARARALMTTTVGLSFGWTGHAVTDPLSFLTAPLQGVHVLVAAAWFGGLSLLWPLSLAGGWAQAWCKDLLGRFSNLALAGMLILGGTGLAVASTRLPGPAGLGETPYGQVLIVKLLWVGAVLALAAIHRFYVLPGGNRGRPGTGRILHLTLALEIVAGFAVLVAASLLATTPPPR